MAKKYVKKVKVTKEELLGRPIRDLTVFWIDPAMVKPFEAVPTRFPRKNDRVSVTSGPGSLTNVLEIRPRDEVDRTKGRLMLVCSNKFYLMQIVSYWEDGLQYDFQIQPTAIKNVGVFKLIDKSRTEEHPGSSTRTVFTKRT